MHSCIHLKPKPMKCCPALINSLLDLSALAVMCEVLHRYRVGGISDVNAKVVRGEVLLGSVPWPSPVKQMCRQMPRADGQLRFEPRQPVANALVTWPQAGWSDMTKTPRNQLSGSRSQMLRVVKDQEKEGKSSHAGSWPSMISQSEHNLGSLLCS